MRNKIICAALILLEIIVCGSREPSLSRETNGHNLHARLGGGGGGGADEGMKAGRRKRETGMAEIAPGGDSSAATPATAGKGTFLTSR